MHAHSKTHNKMVRHVLRIIAHQDNSPFSEIRQKFVVYGDSDITARFWEMLKNNYPQQHFTEVFHCAGCKKFSLE